MELMKLHPRRNIFNVNNLADRLFEDFFTPSLQREENMELTDWRPVVDIYNEGDSTVIKAELPGIDKKDIEVDVNGRTLTLSGKRSSENEVKKESYYRRERFSGSFQRVFNLGEDVNPEKIKADYKNGVLQLIIPKAEEHKVKKIAVN